MAKSLIDEVNWMALSAVNCPLVTISKAQALNITSVISKISIGDISSLVLNSKSDNYTIKSINNILSESAYSSILIGKVNDQLKSKIIYGSLNIGELKKGFRNVDIASTQSDILLTAGKDAAFFGDIATSDVILNFSQSRYPGIIRTGGANSTSLMGLTGSDKNTKSVLKIKASGGKLTLQ